MSDADLCQRDRHDHVRAPGLLAESDAVLAVDEEADIKWATTPPTDRAWADLIAAARSRDRLTSSGCARQL
jgi:hypothetical protein